MKDDLDPNRVLDLTIDAIEAEIQRMLETQADHNVDDLEGLERLLRNATDHASAIHALLAIVSMFNPDSVSHLIGFKFTPFVKPSYTNPEDKEANKNDSKERNTESGKSISLPTSDSVSNQIKVAPKSLFVTTAILAAHDALSIPLLVPHLGGLDELRKARDALFEARIKKIKKIGVVSISFSNADDLGKRKYSKAETSDVAALDASDALKFHPLPILFNLLITLGVGWDNSTQLLQPDQAAPLHDSLEALCAVYPPLSKTICQYAVNTILAGLYQNFVKEIGLEIIPPPGLDLCNKKFV
eukprot:CAMPEP_0184871354 /NCGR_PEP_ID=MMETSP0580-20130426/40670_1 /TAXON_ID=1118495 /ORGANISM="Dactyliosolen fragilissimus" /LENGTH=299 /DNA_ID=CAMNT_0027374001 /DNA_START=2580 /DNA_END=3479 /DNA_ORIENTATION=+